MQISGTLNSINWATSSSTKPMSQQLATTNSKSDVSQNASESVSTSNYDFTSISRREFDELWKAGEIDMDLPPLILPSEGIDITKDMKLQMDAVYDKKINYIEYFEKRIDYQQSLPATPEQRKVLDHYKESLSVLLSLQGELRHPRVDVTA